MKNKLILSSALAATLTFAALSPAAGAQVYVRVAPPRPIIERPGPPPHPGWEWHPGYHRWDGARYVWVPGAYVEGRPGHHWVPGHWDHGPRGHFWVEGHWA
jgi:hypothetical protein